MEPILITGSGLFTPPESISNEELVQAYNAWAARENKRNGLSDDADGAVPLSDAGFVTKASGIRSRYVMNKSGILDIDRMAPKLPKLSADQPCQLAQMAIAAAEEALAMAGKAPSEIDAVLVSCSNLQRAYPAVAVEVQHHLGCGGYAYDMNVACASASFSVQAAVDALAAGHANCVLAVNPEICTGHLNFRDRDSHFIFGDAATALVIERKRTASDAALKHGPLQVLGTRLKTAYSNNIRNDAGFLNRTESPARQPDELLFRQEGRKVFKEVVPLVAELLQSHLTDLGIDPQSVRRFWLHQANLSMNKLIARRLLGREAQDDEAPTILDTYANTSSAGSVIAMHLHRDDLVAGDIGVLSGFGAGYSAGSVVLQQQ